MLLDYCYHTHTYRCGHADGCEEDYVISAIEAGLKTIGFSDHMMVKGFLQPGIRANYEQLDDYVNTINNLKIKYKDKIDIKLGFECEYSPYLKDYYKYLLEVKGFDYLIVGQHLFFDEDLTTFKWVGQDMDKYDALNKYVDHIIEAMSTGYFKYIAHPDLFVRMFPYFDEELIRQTKRLCEASLKYDIPLEVNLGGIRGTRVLKEGRMNYANEDFFNIVSQYGCKVIIGVDAHNPNDFNHEDSITKGLQLINKLNLKEIKRLDFNPIDLSSYIL